MKKKTVLSVVLILAVLFTSSICFADNPIVQTIYTADPAPMVHDGVCYVYTTHDEDGSTYFTMNDWRCYSSTDMVNWTDHGSPLSYTDFSWAKSEASWAAQVIPRNGKFYFYVTVSRKINGGVRAIGVAVSDSPTGPFSDPLDKPLIDLYGWDDIDPTVFIDDDGQAYLYWGNPELYYVKLNEDMISLSGSSVKTTTKPSNYQEGPWFYKRNNLYYMVFATTCCGESIGYATSTGPTGPWTYRDIIMPAQGGSFTNHPGICDFAGNSYFFYHNGALPGGGGFTRSVCVEEFSYNSDGTIPRINMTAQGPSQVGKLDPYVTNQAETICWETGVETETCSEGGMNVANIENGDYIKVKGVDFGDGATSFEARVASNTNGGNIEIRLNSQTGTLVGTCAVSGTGGWQNWTTESCSVSGASGVHDLYFVFKGDSGFLLNFNWWKFEGSGTSTPTPTPGPRSAFTQIEAESYTTQSGIQTEACDEGGEDVGFIENGDYLVFNDIDFENGAAAFRGRVTSAGNGGSIEIRLDSATGTLIGTCPVDVTGGWQSWTTVSTSVNEVSGLHDLYLVFTGESSYLFNLNWFIFDAVSQPTPTPQSNLGDVNNSSTVDIVDALQIAQYYVGLEPSVFIVENADVNCNGAIDILDALIVAQYYVGLITEFC